jgi:hypothetical protein
VASDRVVARATTPPAEDREAAGASGVELVEYAVVGVNLVAGVGGAIPLGRHLSGMASLGMRAVVQCAS